ncbi:hypothetical protein C6P40_001334 [Pichia californica]|uniref:Uncharacterized protein n=1 Tax=Pichia californica TaxID=460514 RepID=A0A9P7BGD2_9ASCO|nr:hypothetical protein C6P42_001436 [[Candida] californica]KAG0688158.1 hypothetical protein C6P40_001334 [[Candida] californica]
MSDKSISHAISGGLSGLVSMAVTYPLVTLSTNAQAKTTKSFDETAKEEQNAKDLNNIEEIDNDDDNDLQSDISSITKLKFRTIPNSVSQDFESKSDEKLSKNSLKIKLLKLLKKLINRLKFIIQNSNKFYSGLESALIGIVSVNFVYYYVYNFTGNYFKKLNNGSTSLDVKDSLLTGLISGLISRIATNPIWVANTRMTVKQKMIEKDINESIDVSKQNTFKVIYEIFQNEGLKGLFSGLVPALILVLSPMIQFTIFEQSKNALLKLRYNKKNVTSLEALLLGSFGKLIAILITYPYYTIRSRMHLNKDDDNKNSFKILYDVIQNEGISALYGGLNAKLLQSVISAGLIFYFKEEMMSVVGMFVNKCSSTSIRKLTRKL